MELLKLETRPSLTLEPLRCTELSVVAEADSEPKLSRKRKLSALIRDLTGRLVIRSTWHQRDTMLSILTMLRLYLTILNLASARLRRN